MAVAGPGSETGPTYTVYDPNIDEYVEVGEEQVTGTGYYASLFDGGGLDDSGSYEPSPDDSQGGGGWIQSAIEGGAAVISSAIGAFAGGSGGNGGQQQPPPDTGEQAGENQIFGMNTNQLLLLAGVGATVYYISQN